MGFLLVLSWNRLLILFVFSLLVVCGYVHAQEVTGDLRFSVRDSLGDPILGVNAAVTGADLQGVRGTVSDGAGRCVILALPPGLISVRLSHPAYHSVVFENVRIQLGKTTSLGDIALRQLVHDMPEIVVSIDRAEIDASSTTYGSNLRPADVDFLPLQRNYKEMIAMLPLSNFSYYGDGMNIGGSTGYENKYVVDGVEVTDPLIQTSGTNLPYNFIREVEVKAGGYEADSRSALGGVLNVVTYSGTNELRGSVFGFYTSNRFGGDRRVGLSDPTQGGFSSFDFGFGLGGPIVRDQLWFFAAYNPTFTRRDVDVPGYGISVDQTIVHSLAAKLTWSATDRLNLVMTATGDPTRQQAVGRDVGVPPAGLTTSDSYFMDVGSGGFNLSLNATYTLAQNFLLEALFARVNYRATGDPSTERGRTEPYFVDYQANVWSGGPSSWWDSFRSATMGKLMATMNAGAHTLRAGLEYKVNGTNNRYGNHKITKYDSTYYQEVVDEGHQTVHDNLPSVFIQDSWQITRSLSVYGGIRWDGQNVVGSNGDVVQKVTLPIQPRLGFVYLPGEQGDHKIFGSFGQFAQEFALFPEMNLSSDQGHTYVMAYDHDPRISRSGADTIWNAAYTISQGIAGLRGQYFDEFSLGYEYAVDRTVKVRLQGLYRTLREAIDDGYNYTKGSWQLGNPGKGELSGYPEPQRDYAALIVTVERSNDRHFNFLASYVLSRNYGNYGGLFDPVYQAFAPNTTLAFDNATNTRDFGTGVLPNDRTHVLKLSGSYRFDFGLSTGIFFTAQSGTPLDEYAYNDTTSILMVPRGTAGRTPAIWDLSARLAYDLPLGFLPDARIILDIFHIASQRTAVHIQQLRGYLDANGQFKYLDPTYGQAYRYQPPMSLRLGMEVRL